MSRFTKTFFIVSAITIAISLFWMHASWADGNTPSDLEQPNHVSDLEQTGHVSDLEQVGHASAQTTSAAFDFAFAIIEHVTPTHGGPALFCDGNTTKGVEVVGVKLGTWYNRSGYLDGILTTRQKIRGAALTVEPFANTNFAIGPAYFKNNWGAIAAWHIAF